MFNPIKCKDEVKEWSKGIHKDKDESLELNILIAV